MQINPLFLIFFFTLTLIGSLSLSLRPYVYLTVGLSLISSVLIELIKGIEESSGHVHAAETIEFVHAFHYATGALLFGMVVSSLVMTLNQKREKGLEHLGSGK